MKANLLDEIVHAQKRGEVRGIPSICSAHPWVLKAAIQVALRNPNIMAPAVNSGGEGAASSETLKVLLIESTCNQVNQFGGYTGMTPGNFAAYVHDMAAENGLPRERLILGGDHLGPSPWQKEAAASAMQKAEIMVRAYVQAGYTKIHLDASMRLGDDDASCPLDLEQMARRTARLARVAEESLACASLPWRPVQGTAGTGAKVPKPSQGLRYVIGSEVPIPGGAIAHVEGVRVTKVGDARCTLEATQAAFRQEGLEGAWERVIALVVQPGVEFGDDFVLDYRPGAARHLRRFAETMPLVYEAHSTDYQTGKALRELVRDHFAILKIGPALTFAFREAVFALVRMESELVSPAEHSQLIERLDEVMLREPAYWKEHYHGTPEQLAFARKYSLSDRVRYYWSNPQVQAALGRLFQNLRGKALPLTLISQYLPVQMERVRSGRIENTPEALVLDKINGVLDEYARACG